MPSELNTQETALKVLATFTSDAPLTRLSWSPDGKVIAIPSQAGELNLVRANSMTVIDRISISAKPLWITAWSPNGQIVAIGGRDNTIHLLKAATSEHFAKLQAHTDDVHAVAWSPDGTVIASASFDGTVKIWNVNPPELTRSIRAHVGRIEDLIWDEERNELITAGRDGSIKFWNPNTGEQTNFVDHCHEGFVLRLVLNPRNGTLYSCSSDGTVKIWIRETLSCVSVIQGFSGSPHGLSLSADGNLLAVKDDRKQIRIVRVDTNELVTIIPATADHQHWYGGVAFHPAENSIIYATNNDRTAELASFDQSLISNVVAEQTAPAYVNCRIGLLGNTGVGKSALARALSGLPFAPTESTHGTQAMLLRRETINESGRPVVQEVYLWDFAGQPTYRLLQGRDVEQLSAAVLVVDNRNNVDAFEEMREWELLLRLASIRTANRMPRIVAVARSDRGMARIPRTFEPWEQEVDNLKALVVTSAKLGTGITELGERLISCIDWTRLPVLVSDEQFQRLRVFVRRLSADGQIVERMQTLHSAFCDEAQRERVEAPPFDEFKNLIASLETQNLVRILGFRNLVLLDPVYLSAYASSILMAAEQSPDGEGSVIEEELLAGQLACPPDTRLPNRSDECDVLHAALENFIAAGVVLRNEVGDQHRLRFPSTCCRTFPGKNPEGTHRRLFQVRGLMDHCWATLLHTLDSTRMFSSIELWSGLARLEWSQHRASWVTCTATGMGFIRIAISHDTDVPQESQSLLAELCRAHLAHTGLPQSLFEIEEVECPTCHTQFAPEGIQQRRSRGYDWINCSICDTRIDLGGSASRSTKQLTSIQADVQQTAQIKRATANVEMKEERELFDVFVSYSHQDAGHAVDFARDLKRQGLRPWIDLWQLTPGKPWLRSLQQSIENISCAAVLIGPSGVGPWQEEETSFLLEQFLARQCSVIPVVLPGAKFMELPGFLRTMQAVDFNRQEPDPMMMLAWGITGVRPDRLDVDW